MIPYFSPSRIRQLLRLNYDQLYPKRVVFQRLAVPPPPPPPPPPLVVMPKDELKKCFISIYITGSSKYEDVPPYVPFGENETPYHMLYRENWKKNIKIKPWAEKAGFFREYCFEGIVESLQDDLGVDAKTLKSFVKSASNRRYYDWDLKHPRLETPEFTDSPSRLWSQETRDRYHRIRDELNPGRIETFDHIKLEGELLLPKKAWALNSSWYTYDAQGEECFYIHVHTNTV